MNDKLYLIKILLSGSYKNKTYLINKKHLPSLRIYTEKIGEEDLITKGGALKITKYTPSNQYTMPCNVMDDVDVLNYLRDMSDNPLRIFKLTHKTIDDLLTPIEVETYLNDPTPIGVQLVSTALDKKLLDDESYEVFLPLRYWKYTEYSKFKRKVYIERRDVLVSNRGRVIVLGSYFEPRVCRRDHNGYPTFRIGMGTYSQSIKVHRAVGCIFIFNNTNTPLSRLTINHKDGIKHHNETTNLEWMTNKQNAKHSRAGDPKSPWNDNNLGNPSTLPMLGEVTIRGNYFGFKFVVFGFRHALKFGFEIAKRKYTGGLYASKGCTFTKISRGEVAKHPSIEDVDQETINYLKLSLSKKLKLICK